MRPSLNLEPRHAIALAAVLAASIPVAWGVSSQPAIKPPTVITLDSHPFLYRPAGDFTRDGKPVNAQPRMVRLARALTIMTHQVTAADYQRCVLAHGCPPAASATEALDRPAVKVSWHDANSYATWLSRELGATYRLPTDEEWVFAAGSRFRDEVLPGGDRDPAQRLLERYELESDRDEAVDSRPRSLGSFGSNENGLLDLAGNVWEWTDTCFVHQVLNATGTGASIVNCGVRVVEGRHRTYMADFIRDPRTGGCSVGKPPKNLGFRLVRESNGWARLRSFLQGVAL